MCVCVCVFMCVCVCVCVCVCGHTHTHTPRQYGKITREGGREGGREGERCISVNRGREGGVYGLIEGGREVYMGV
jgi:hypothetical protein